MSYEYNKSIFSSEQFFYYLLLFAFVFLVSIIDLGSNETNGCEHL